MQEAILALILAAFLFGASALWLRSPKPPTRYNLVWSNLAVFYVWLCSRIAHSLGIEEVGASGFILFGCILATIYLAGSSAAYLNRKLLHGIIAVLFTMVIPWSLLRTDVWATRIADFVVASTVMGAIQLLGSILTEGRQKLKWTCLILSVSFFVSIAIPLGLNAYFFHNQLLLTSIIYSDWSKTSNLAASLGFAARNLRVFVYAGIAIMPFYILTLILLMYYGFYVRKFQKQ